MNMKFKKMGSAYMPTGDESYSSILPVLPPANYVIKAHPELGLYFDMVDSFSFDGKIYGSPIRRVERILNTYQKRSASTGVLLTGEKGSGKTLLAKLLSIHGAKLNYPTIIINNAWRGDAFNQLLQNITQPCIILFDEFEKVYNGEDQEAILTLLDGVFPTKKLFIFTSNDYTRINTHLQNRPGRIFYNIKYDGLEAEFVREYCEDNLNNKANISDVMKVFHLFDKFNFDILKALVEEMNRYNETAQEAMLLLNAKTYSYEGSSYSIEVIYKGKLLDKNAHYPNSLRHNPLASGEFTINVTLPVVTTTSTRTPKTPQATTLDDLAKLLTDDSSVETKTVTKRKRKESQTIQINITDETKKFVAQDGTIMFKIDNDFVVKCDKVYVARNYTQYMGEDFS